MYVHSDIRIHDNITKSNSTSRIRTRTTGIHLKQMMRSQRGSRNIDRNLSLRSNVKDRPSPSIDARLRIQSIVDTGITTAAGRDIEDDVGCNAKSLAGIDKDVLYEISGVEGRIEGRKGGEHD